MSLKAAADKFQKFCSVFKNEADCFPILFELKWPDGFRCPRCSHSHFYLISTRRIPLYECRSCHAQSSLIAGTIMEGSRTPIHRWFQAIFLHAQPRCINARQLSEAIHVTYKTAWLICHKIRHAMTSRESTRLLSGIVRVSDSIYSKRLTPSFDWHKQEQPLLVGASDDGNGTLGPIVIKLQSKASLKDKYDCPDTAPFIREHIHPDDAENTIVTRRYGRNMNKELAWMGYNVTWWIGRTFLGIGPKHLQAYLDQFCYYYNRSRSTLYVQLLADCINSSRITYNELTKSDSRSRSNRLTRTPRQHSIKLA
ncbi:transposase [Cohnella phaseoli]|uniref:Transposase-like protein n=1 Tax=Cohnella phaseoli TaxID=456490 RepID=A0A3D9KS38_9BACL|nr:transposase [Cohnella phaseoli]RED89457.1 transposase-like protein [Cohnella phaseoli]